MSLIDTFLEEGLTNPPPFIAKIYSEIDPNNPQYPPYNEIYIAVRVDSVIGTGLPDDPYNGSTDTLLDNLLRDTEKIKPNMTIRFGPGLFQTKGFASPNVTPLGGWILRNGVRLIGSGMYQTTLQLVKLSPAAGPPSFGSGAIIGSDVGTWNIEISDMTLDANLARLPLNGGNPTRMVGGGIGLGATVDKFRMSRVRIINWASHAVYIETIPPTHSECFPVFVLPKEQRPDSYGEGVIEDGVVEQPDHSPARESTLINQHSVSNQAVATIRNTRVSGDYTTGSPPPAIEILGLTYSDPILELVLKWPHGMQGGPDPNAFKRDEVLITGSPNSNLNKRHLLTIAPPDFRTLRLSIAGLSGQLFATGMLAQHYVPEEMLVSLSYSGTTITVTTLIPHRRKAGDFIRISGAVVDPNSVNSYNGSFEVALVTGDYTFTYETDEAPSEVASGEIWLDRWPSKGVHIAGFEDPYTEYVTLITTEPHFKAVGDWVQVSGITDTSPLTAERSVPPPRKKANSYQ